MVNFFFMEKKNCPLNKNQLGGPKSGTNKLTAEGGLCTSQLALHMISLSQVGRHQVVSGPRGPGGVPHVLWGAAVGLELSTRPLRDPYTHSARDSPRKVKNTASLGFWTSRPSCEAARTRRSRTPNGR